MRLSMPNPSELAAMPVMASLPLLEVKADPGFPRS